MRKKGCLLLAALALLLAGCGEKTQKSAEDLQARYAQMQGYEAIVETAVPREDETLHYTLSLEHSNGETRAAVLAPQIKNGNHHQQTDLINMATDKLFERDALALRQW